MPPTSLFRVTFSHIVSQGEGISKGRVPDLKTLFRARQYTRRIIHSLGKNAEEFYRDDSLFQAAEIARIHAKAA